MYVPVQNTPFYKRIRRQITVVSAAEDAAAEVGDMVEVPGAQGADPPSKRDRHSFTLNYDSAMNHHSTNFYVR